MRCHILLFLQSESNGEVTLTGRSPCFLQCVIIRVWDMQLTCSVIVDIIYNIY
jgi:hypothetical protein